MEGFHKDLISDIVSLVEKQYRQAKSEGFTPDYFILCGGPARNPWFRGVVFHEVKSKYPDLECKEVTR
jgi:hypothetical protein